jgi:hypothetical protein
VGYHEPEGLTAGPVENQPLGAGRGLSGPLRRYPANLSVAATSARLFAGSEAL